MGKHNTVLFFAYINLLILVITVICYCQFRATIKPIYAEIVSVRDEIQYTTQRFHYELSYTENGEEYSYDYMPDFKFTDNDTPPAEYSVGNKVKIYVYKDGMSFYYGDPHETLYTAGTEALILLVLLFISRRSIIDFKNDILKRYKYMVIFSAVMTVIFFGTFIYVVSLKDPWCYLAWLYIAALGMVAFCVIWLSAYIVHRVKYRNKTSEGNIVG